MLILLCCWLVWHQISRNMTVNFLPSVKSDRNIASNTGAVDAGVVFLCVGLKSLEMASLKLMSSRDFTGIMILFIYLRMDTIFL